MSSVYNEVEKNKNVLHDNKIEDLSSLTFLKKVLETSPHQLRNKWSKQLLYKLYIIHNKFNSAHCNICLDSLMVDKNNNLVLINLSNNHSCNTSLINGATHKDDRFKAPELIRNCEKSKAGDIWKAGICIYYMINSTFLWKIASKSDINFCFWAEKGIFPKIANNSYKRVLKKMLCVDYKERPNIKGVIRTTMDTGIDQNVISKFYLVKKYKNHFNFNL